MANLNKSKPATKSGSPLLKPKSQNRARQIRDRSQRDPVWWAQTFLGVELWGRQREALESLRDFRRTSVASCNGSGKSFGAAVAILWWCSSFDDAFALSTATKYTQVRVVLWREIARLVRNARVDFGIDLRQTEARWKHGSTAIGLTAPEYDETKMQGYRGAHTLIVVDEACGVSKAIMEGVTAMLTGHSAKLLSLGNPTDAGSEFARSFTSEGVQKIWISAFDTPNFSTFGITEADIADGSWRSKQTGPLPNPALITPEWVSERWNDWGPSDPRYVARVLGRFPSESDDTLIPMHWIIDAFEREQDKEKQGVSELGVDIARSGSDDTVIVHRQGDHARVYSIVHGNDTMQTCGAVVRATADTRARAVKVDEIGVGGGVVDRLRELGQPVVGVNVSRAAYDSAQFINLRAEGFWNLRRLFEKGEISVDAHDRLASELHALRWFLTSSGKIQLEAKDETKRRTGRSPDVADALMLAFCEAGASTLPLCFDDLDVLDTGPKWDSGG